MECASTEASRVQSMDVAASGKHPLTVARLVAILCSCRLDEVARAQRRPRPPGASVQLTGSINCEEPLPSVRNLGQVSQFSVFLLDFVLRIVSGEQR